MRAILPPRHGVRLAGLHDERLDAAGCRITAMPRRLDHVTVTPYPDGPIIIRGPVVVMAEDGGRVLRSRNATALCRCGLSGRQPLCDGSHKQARGQRRSAAPTADS